MLLVEHQETFSNTVVAAIQPWNRQPWQEMLGGREVSFSGGVSSEAEWLFAEDAIVMDSWIGKGVRLDDLETPSSHHILWFCEDAME